MGPAAGACAGWGAVAHPRGHPGGAAEPGESGSPGPILLQVNDHLLQERLKRWYPE